MAPPKSHQQQLESRDAAAASGKQVAAKITAKISTASSNATSAPPSNSNSAASGDEISGSGAGDGDIISPKNNNNNNLNYSETSTMQQETNNNNDEKKASEARSKNSESQKQTITNTNSNSNKKKKSSAANLTTENSPRGDAIDVASDNVTCEPQNEQPATGGGGGAAAATGEFKSKLSAANGASGGEVLSSPDEVVVVIGAAEEKSIAAELLPGQVKSATFNEVAKQNNISNSNSNAQDAERLIKPAKNQASAAEVDSKKNNSNQLQQQQQETAKSQQNLIKSNNSSHNFIYQLKTVDQQFEDLDNNSSSSTTGNLKHNQQTFCKRRQLSYLQTLLLRRWPCLAITICIMSSLIFGVILSALTVYFMHGLNDCSSLASAAMAAASVPPHELMGRPSDFDAPLDVAALASSSSSGYSNSESELGARNFGANSDASGGLGAGERPRFQRLPKSVWPLHYDLFVQPYIAEPYNFTGRVAIRVKCLEPTSNITLHTLDLQLDEKSLSLELAPASRAANNETQQQQQQQQPPRQLIKRQASGAGQAPKISGLDYDKQLQYSIVKLDRPLEANREYLLTIDFTGLLNDDLAGFYKIRYERQNSTEPTWIAATQFQATDARRAFPCFDEPLYKATFSIQIKHWRNMTALSNMPIVESKVSQDGLWVTDTFGKSHKMSTYLVAYCVTNFESRSEGNISVWTRPGFAHTAEYALKIAGKILRHYEDFFGIEYPLPKMDMIALPDFNAGAMENWGLITYRETAMLYDEVSSSIANKQRVAVVVAHELAHQWFGNLVTPKWWDDLWLNEGFASYVEYIGVDHVEPKWRMLDQFVVEEVQNVFRMDGLSSSHQISIPVNNPDEISEIFDHISYAKGASIIRMMSYFLTEEAFKTGLKRYLRALKYNNAEQSDLWAHLTEAQRMLRKNSSTSEMVDVGKVMNSWTLQTGYPLVTLTRDYSANSGQLSQARFTAFKVSHSGNTTAAANSTLQRWDIPITMTSRSEQNWQPTTRLWMHQNSSEPLRLSADLMPKSSADWMLLNVQQVGYYRVNYDQKNWRLLIEQLDRDHTKISNTNRAQILDDIFELAKSQMIDYRFAMEATKYLRNEVDYLPWDAALMSFSYIDDMLQRSAIYGDWKDYISELTSHYYSRYKQMDWHIARRQNKTSELDNDVLEQYNQVNAIAWACQVDQHCIQKAKSVFAGWKRSGDNNINPALRYTTYCTAIENGDKQDWDFLWSAYEREQNASERDRIMRALGCSRELWILARYLDWTFSKTKPIRRQDGAYVFRMIAKNNYGRDIAFNFMRERWSTIKDYYGKTSFSLGNLIRSVSTSMNTQIELNQLINFYESIKADVGTGKRSFQIAIEEVESNVAWRNRNYKILEDWLQEQRLARAASKAGKVAAAAAA